MIEKTKPISYVKAHAAEIFKELEEGRSPIVITQNGEARAVLVDVESYNETQETMALLAILAHGDREIDEGRFSPAAEVFPRIRNSRK